jgi:hypothetical protein
VAGVEEGSDGAVAPVVPVTGREDGDLLDEHAVNPPTADARRTWRRLSTVRSDVTMAG